MANRKTHDRVRDPRALHAGVLAASASILLAACHGTSELQSSEQLALPPGDWTGRCGKQAEVRGGREAKAVRSPGDVIDDRAQILEPESEAEFARTIERYHRETCHQFAVLTVSSLGQQSIEDYARAAVNRAELGYRGFNNGLLILVAPNDGAARIEVGCGLEDVISDQRASEIMQRDLIPNFRTGEYEEGVRAGMHALMALARDKHIPAEFRPAACGL